MFRALLLPVALGAAIAGCADSHVWNAYAPPPTNSTVLQLRADMAAREAARTAAWEAERPERERQMAESDRRNILEFRASRERRIQEVEKRDPALARSYRQEHEQSDRLPPQLANRWEACVHRLTLSGIINRRLPTVQAHQEAQRRCLAVL